MDPSECPVIVNQSLYPSDVEKSLKSQGYKLKISQNTESDSVIFPTSAVAFLLCQTKDIQTKVEITSEYQEVLDEDFMVRINRFCAVNRNSHVIIMSPLFGLPELVLVTELQNKFMFGDLTILMAHNDIAESLLRAECVEVMTSVSLVYGKEFRSNINRHVRDTIEAWSNETAAHLNAERLINLNSEECNYYNDVDGNEIGIDSNTWRI